MSFQKLVLLICLLGLFTVGNQRIYSTSDSDTNVTVTHPSVFHDEYLDTKSTIQGLDNQPRKARGPKSLDLEGQSRSFFEGLSDTSSDTSESSDATDASETSQTSDSDAKGNAFDNISRRAKEFEGKAYRNFDKQKRLAKLQARKYWQALKFKIMKQANATGVSQVELKQELKNAKRDAKQAWRDLKFKIQNGNENFETLLESLKKSKPFLSADLEGHNSSLFEGLSDTSSSDTSESSDATDASETSDSDARFNNISRKVKEFEGKAYRKFDKQKRLAKLQAKKNWEALKSKITNNANATGISQAELKQELRNAKRDFKQAWKELKWKVKNGNDILDDLVDNMDQLNPGKYAKRGSTEITNETTL